MLMKFLFCSPPTLISSPNKHSSSEFKIGTHIGFRKGIQEDREFGDEFGDGKVMVHQSLTVQYSAFFSPCHHPLFASSTEVISFPFLSPKMKVCSLLLAIF